MEQQARERLEKLSALRKIKPVDMTRLSQQVSRSSGSCTSPPGAHGVRPPARPPVGVTRPSRYEYLMGIGYPPGSVVEAAPLFHSPTQSVFFFSTFGWELRYLPMNSNQSSMIHHSAVT